MELRNIRITNFRALHDVFLPAGSFCCVIGENNVGKSSLLHALMRFCDGKKLQETDYYAPEQPVTILVELSNITSEDLSRLAEEHRARIAEVAVNGTLKLLRRFGPGGNSSLKWMTKVPKDTRFQPEIIDSYLKGKKGATLVNEAKNVWPEITSQLDSATSQSKIRDLLEAYCKTLPEAELTETEADLPTGIDNSIHKLLPELIYIPAVKDIMDEMKSKDTTSFGKVLGLLLNVIEPQLASEKELFALLQRKLNRVKEDGEDTDGRLPEIVEAENAIQRNLRENFPQASVELKIPPPDIESILSNAKLDVNDGGVGGPIETKGDGLKRSVLFAIFRAYLDLARKPGWQKKESTQKTKAHYLFLYEEPELYLHPKAQKTLFDALSFVSKDHQVVVTTHSPLFFAPDTTTTFVKIAKTFNPSSLPKPVSNLMPLNLQTNLPAKEAFQLVSFENNNIALFASDVVLVEGDSDVLALKHISKTLNTSWNFDRGRVTMLRVSGKGGFRRFKEFFEHFGIRVHIISDLDVVVRDFEKLMIPADDPIHSSRSDLLQEVDKIAGTTTPDADRIRQLFTQRTWRQKWDDCVKALEECKKTRTPPTDDQFALLQLMIDEERHQPRIQTLKSNVQLRPIKLALINAVRSRGIHILEKGEIENYFPSDLVGGDKISKAEDLTKKVATQEAVLLLSEAVNSDQGHLTEFEVIFSAVFAVG